jgi:hypothetical protein
VVLDLELGPAFQLDLSGNFEGLCWRVQLALPQHPEPAFRHAIAAIVAAIP